MEPLAIRRIRPAESNAKAPLRETASQTAGPYVHIGTLPNFVGIDGVFDQDLRSNYVPSEGQPIKIVGQVFEGDGIVCKDILLEFWHADSKGDFTNGIWLRSQSNLDTGVYSFETVKPGAISDDGGQIYAPFITVWIVARGINTGLLTRLYFGEDNNANDQDPYLKLVDDARRHTLIASPTGKDGEYHFDIHLQGENETVFFDV